MDRCTAISIRCFVRRIFCIGDATGGWHRLDKVPIRLADSSIRSKKFGVFHRQPKRQRRLGGTSERQEMYKLRKTVSRETDAVPLE